MSAHRPVRTSFAPFATYCQARLDEDPHLWATALFDEVTALGYDRSYPPVHPQPAGPRAPPGVRAVPPGDGPAGRDHRSPRRARKPNGTGWICRTRRPGGTGTAGRRICWSGRCRIRGSGGVCWPRATDQPHLVDAQHRVAHRLGGVTRVWRFDRMATVVHPDTGKVTASYAAVAKHYGVQVKPCPPRRGNRKGVVEKANHTAAQRWWRTLPDDVTVAQAQARLDAFCARERPTPGSGSSTIPGPVAPVAALAAAERLRPVPAAAVPGGHGGADGRSPRRPWCPSAGTGTRCHRSWPDATVTVQHRLGSPVLSIVTGNGVVVAVHHRVADGTGATVRTDTHVTALTTAVLAAFSTDRPHRRKQRIPPGPAALAAADRLRGNPTGGRCRRHRPVRLCRPPRREGAP